MGDNESMVTDLKGLLDAGLDLSSALWAEAADTFDWEAGMDRYVIHQVSQVHTDALCDRLQIDKSLVPRTFPAFGNIGPASVPFTLAGEQEHLSPGDRVLLMGIGSGLNGLLPRAGLVSATSTTGTTGPGVVGPSPIPHALPGLDPTWSRTVTVRDPAGRPRTWHLLDNGVAPVQGTVLCVHGNPTWSYLWRGMLAAAPPGWRVVAADHLGMGYSERPRPRRARAHRLAARGRPRHAHRRPRSRRPGRPHSRPRLGAASSPSAGLSRTATSCVESWWATPLSPSHRVTSARR